MQLKFIFHNSGDFGLPVDTKLRVKRLNFLLFSSSGIEDVLCVFLTNPAQLAVCQFAGKDSILHFQLLWFVLPGYC